MLERFKRRKEKYDYFDSFEETASLILESSEFLSINLENYQLYSLEKRLVEMHKIKGAADKNKKQMMHYLYQDFLPPIEREGIIALAHALNTVLNTIEDILIRMDMYQIKLIQPDMMAFMELVEKASLKLTDMIKNLPNFKNPKQLLQNIEEISEIEEKGDAIYHRSIKNSHIDEVDSNESFRYSKIYDAFEESLNSFEELTSIVEAIVLTNT